MTRCISQSVVSRCKRSVTLFAWCCFFILFSITIIPLFFSVHLNMVKTILPLCLCCDGIIDRDLCSTDCGHFYHGACIRNYLNKKRRCLQCNELTDINKLRIHYVDTSIDPGTVRLICFIEYNNDELFRSNHLLLNQQITMKLKLFMPKLVRSTTS